MFYQNYYLKPSNICLKYIKTIILLPILDIQIKVQCNYMCFCHNNYWTTMAHNQGLVNVTNMVEWMDSQPQKIILPTIIITNTRPELFICVLLYTRYAHHCCIGISIHLITTKSKCNLLYPIKKLCSRWWFAFES